MILGPTAGGKSELAVGLAELTGGEVIGADSMQVYRHMDAGTAKPSVALRRRAPHHLIDIVEPTERFTVADWLEGAENLIGRLQSPGVSPIVVGGTNLYLKALLEGMFDGPPADEAFRASLAEVSAQDLHRKLAAVDGEAADRIKPNDRKRIVRALEVYESTGRPISQLQTQWGGATPPLSGRPAGPPAPPASPAYHHNPILIGLSWPTDVINRRINLRVKAMFAPESVSPELACEICPNGESLPDEVRRLESAGLLGPQARQALGYKQVLEHVAGESTLDKAFEKTKILTRRFAKSQRTWLRRFGGVFWLEAGEKPHSALLSEAGAIVTSNN